MASVTSGELLYGLCDLHKINLLPAEESGRRSGNNTISSNNELQTFLAGKLQDQTDLHLIRELRERIETAHEASIAHLKHSVPHELSAINRALVLECQIEKERLAHTIHKLQKTFEAQAMQSILRYVSVVKEDMDSAKKQLDHERQQKEALKKQALVCRDFLMFCCHLRQETSGRLEITCLPHSSAQFIRCVKAVHDNLGDSFGKLTRRRRIKPEDARVLNVFKVKNLHLSKKLHAAMIKSPGIKAKGLFCCFPAEHVFSFAVHGLYVQSLPNGANHSLEAQDRIFGTPWVFANPTPLLPLSEELASTYSITGTASKLAKRFGSGPLLRFCKLSTISSVAMFSEEVREKGVFLSLCRVLIDRPKTIAGHIEDVDIVDAMREGYDAVYSSLSEEYVLLQPSHVLPEFLIHLYFRHVDGVFAEENDSHELPLAPMLTPHHAVDQQECSGAEMALLSNECFNLNARREVERSEREGCKKSHFDSQEAVKIKRAALLQIENAVEEFRSKQKSLMEDSSERLLGIFRQFDERNFESPRPGPSPERRL